MHKDQAIAVMTLLQQFAGFVAIGIGKRDGGWYVLIDAEDVRIDSLSELVWWLHSHGHLRGSNLLIHKMDAEGG